MFSRLKNNDSPTQPSILKNEQLSVAKLINKERAKIGVNKSAEPINSVYTHIKTISKNHKSIFIDAQPLFGALCVVKTAGKTNFLMPADAQKDFDFTGGLSTMAKKMGLTSDAKVWWVGGDLTGLFSTEQSETAVDCLESFIDSEFFYAGKLRSDRLLISEYAGPENKRGDAYSGIRCVGKLLERRPDLLINFLPYAVIDGGAPEWFQSIGAIPHVGANNMYLVCGERTGENDPWDSNGLAKNAVILEGGSRTLGYIFEIIANDGQVIALHGFRKRTKLFMSAAAFIGALQDYLNENPKANCNDAIDFYKNYIEEHPAFNPNASDAHTKIYFVNKAWELFKQKDLINKIKTNIAVYSGNAWLSRNNDLEKNIKKV